MEKPKFEAREVQSSEYFKEVLDRAFASHLSSGNEGYDLACQIRTALSDGSFRPQLNEKITDENAQQKLKFIISSFSAEPVEHEMQRTLAIDDLVHAIRITLFG